MIAAAHEGAIHHIGTSKYVSIMYMQTKTDCTCSVKAHLAQLLVQSGGPGLSWCVKL